MVGVYIHLSVGTIEITWNVLVTALFVELMELIASFIID